MSISSSGFVSRVSSFFPSAQYIHQYSVVFFQLLFCFFSSYAAISFNITSHFVLFFLSAIRSSSVARPQPIFANSRRQRCGHCQGGGSRVPGKRRVSRLEFDNLLWLPFVFLFCSLQDVLESLSKSDIKHI